MKICNKEQVTTTTSYGYLMEKYWLAVGFQEKFIIQFDLVLNRARG